MHTNSSKLKLIIVEDQESWRDKIRTLLQNFFSELIVIAEMSTTIPTAIDTIKATNPDIVILDLKIGNRWSWEILNEFPEPGFFTIFITSFKEYRDQCILESSSIGFIDKKDLTETALGQYINQAISLNKRIQREKHLILMQILNGEDIISVETLSGDLEKIHRDEIVYVVVQDKVVVYYTFRGIISEASSLSKALRLLNFAIEDNEPDSIRRMRFFQIHRDTIINLRYLTRILKKTVELAGLGSSPLQLEISRNSKIKLLKIRN